MRLSVAVPWVQIAILSLNGWLPAASEQAAVPRPRESSRSPHTLDKEGILQSLKQKALPDLIQSLTEKKPSRRLRLIRIYGDLHDHRATPYLRRAYTETAEEGIRCKLLESMGKLHDPALFEWFIERLEDPSPAIQCFAIWALGELKMPQAISSLRQKLWSPIRFVRMTAIDALGKTGRAPGLAAELDVLLRDADVQIRYLAAKSLGEVAGPDATPELLERLVEEPSTDVQEALARTVARVGGTVGAGHFIELLKNPISQATEHWAEVGLEAADPAVVLPEIAPWLDGEEFRLKILGARILSALELPVPVDPAAPWMDPVKRWAQGSDPISREAAHRLLERVAAADQRDESGVNR